jgi:hypothetical protein
MYRVKMPCVDVLKIGDCEMGFSYIWISTVSGPMLLLPIPEGKNLFQRDHFESEEHYEVT